MYYLRLILLICSFLSLVPEFLAIKRNTEFLEKTCVLPSNQGRNCKDRKEIKAYYFNAKTFRCGSFMYKGCGGNANRFKTFDDCVDSCQTPWFVLKNSEEKDSASKKTVDCTLPPASGNCKALIPMWYFNKRANNCSTFSYGGCGGNSNRFDEEEDCLQACNPDGIEAL